MPACPSEWPAGQHRPLALLRRRKRWKLDGPRGLVHRLTGTQRTAHVARRADAYRCDRRAHAATWRGQSARYLASARRFEAHLGQFSDTGGRRAEAGPGNMVDTLQRSRHLPASLVIALSRAARGTTPGSSKRSSTAQAPVQCSGQAGSNVNAHVRTPMNRDQRGDGLAECATATSRCVGTLLAGGATVATRTLLASACLL